jgi:hypothetical protein
LKSFACGTERWNVKVVQDSHNKFFFQNNDLATGKLQIFLTTTIALLQQPYPFGLDPTKFLPKAAANQRKGIAEFRMWTLTAFLQAKRDEGDEDYHLIFKDGDTAGWARRFPRPNTLKTRPNRSKQ